MARHREGCLEGGHAAGTLEDQFEYTSFIGTPDASPNRISFAAASMADVNVGDTFKVGTFTFTNGFWYPAAIIGFEITTHSSNPALDNKTFEGSINVVVTNNSVTVTDPVINADYFYLSDAAGNPLNALGSVRVYEAAFQPHLELPGRDQYVHFQFQGRRGESRAAALTHIHAGGPDRSTRKTADRIAACRRAGAPAAAA